ncbi:hypothetical protein [Hydrogenophaga sp.]|uniref:hypothetical protein n=2 Tax=unclassified Hydrogenophaga TaxID=2610897 RepID=UPI00257C1411|nr:hypothetical protein [Hydrogenophaga sp.]
MAAATAAQAVQWADEAAACAARRELSSIAWKSSRAVACSCSAIHCIAAVLASPKNFSFASSALISGNCLPSTKAANSSRVRAAAPMERAILLMRGSDLSVMGDIGYAGNFFFIVARFEATHDHAKDRPDQPAAGPPAAARHGGALREVIYLRYIPDSINPPGASMKYGVDFQYLPKGASRPIDDGVIVGIEGEDDAPPPIPNVGDYVNIMSANGDYANFQGRVRSRLFNYWVGADGQKGCGVNIVVEATDDDWSLLIKE